MLVGVGSPAVLLALLGGASLLNRPLPERWTGPLAAAAMTDRVRRLARRACRLRHDRTDTTAPLVRRLVCFSRRRHRDRVPRRSAVARLRRALGRDRGRRVGVLQSISAPGARLQPLLRPAGDVRHGHAARGAGRQRRSPVRRLGVGRPQFGAARRVLSRAARTRVERPSRVLGLPHQRRRHAVGGGAAASRRRHRQPLAAVRRRSRGCRPSG